MEGDQPPSLKPPRAKPSPPKDGVLNQIWEIKTGRKWGSYRPTSPVCQIEERWQQQKNMIEGGDNLRQKLLEEKFRNTRNPGITARRILEESKSKGIRTDSRELEGRNRDGII